ncbi:hypothetical protein GGU11DRAFT_772828 [Lentinula aff. detonsa]|uniref:Zn(2)-C6 fungal-type domain-containing protein n=1 Tax=Lentinula aff. detonsa TaxID=2804958 RepID=A0AA38KWJ6_9AGAR|nr:hypothetical protein GGU10DRAFT_387006 [Lentinula aff. detonsa]KAJ3800516.1 hypothetical protein GGU11DRAFT_772828 [Lentinula aff. detonsa]
MSKAPTGRSPKGTACINCRQRKIRCDGKRPVCGLCSATLPSACRYSDGSASIDQLLQEEIAILETRLQQLESPSDPSRTLALRAATSSSSVHRPLSISLNMRQALLRSFLPYSFDFGFFLEYSRFSSSLSSSSSQEKPFPSILSACQLIGAYLSPVNELSALQSAFLSQALYDTSSGLSRNPAHLARSILHCVQAEILLAQYFFINGRTLEGKYRVSNAVSMVLGGGFHKIRSVDPYAFQGRAGTQSIPPPIGPEEEGERVNALWQVLILNACWTAAEGSPSNIAYEVPESRIDTPWPLDSGSYSQSSFPENIRSSRTIQNFLTNYPDNGKSLLAVHAKAAILFERASLLQHQYRPNMNLAEATRFQQTFNNLDKAINNIATILPSLTDHNLPRNTIRRLLIVHTLCRVASILLHGIFEQQDPASQAQVIIAADSVVMLLRSVNLNDFPFIDPIMGHLWMNTINIYIKEIKIHIATGMPRRLSLKDMMDSVEFIVATMQIFAQKSSFIETQLKLARQSMVNISRQ